MTDEQIDHMVERFLTWKLPEDFEPDGGISFRKKTIGGDGWEETYKPVGTNLLNARQAEAMVCHMLSGLPASSGTGYPASEFQLGDDVYLSPRESGGERTGKVVGYVTFSDKSMGYCVSHLDPQVRLPRLSVFRAFEIRKYDLPSCLSF
ncbi:hypothetical protein [Martelella sp. FOR1707]